MRIALLNIQYYPNIEGGAEISTQKLAEELAKEHEVFVVCDGKYTGIEEKINGVKVIRMPARIEYHNKIERVLTRSCKIQCFKLLKKIFKEINPEILHTNNLHEFSVIVWKVASELKIPIVHTLRDYTLLHTVRHFEQIIQKHISKEVSVITAPSQFTLDTFLGKKYFQKAINAITVPNAIDFDLEKMDRNCDTKVNRGNELPVRFAYLGRYAPEKGVDWLISVFHQEQLNAELHLYGKGELNTESNDILESDKRIFDHGFMAENNLQEELQKMDVVVIPSLWEEPFGRTILDGYKSLCPVIITNRGGMPEVVDNYKTGIIIDEESNDNMRKALEYFLDRDHIRSMFPAIKIKLLDYSIEKQADTFKQLYLSAIESIL